MEYDLAPKKRTQRVPSARDRRRFTFYENERRQENPPTPIEAWRRAMEAYPTRKLKRLAEASEDGTIEISERYLESTMARAVERFEPARMAETRRELVMQIARRASSAVDALHQTVEGKNADGSVMSTKDHAAVGSVRVKAAETQLKALKIIDNRAEAGSGLNVQVNVGERNAEVRAVLKDPAAHEAAMKLQKVLREKARKVDATVRDA